MKTVPRKGTTSLFEIRKEPLEIFITINALLLMRMIQNHSAIPPIEVNVGSTVIAKLAKPILNPLNVHLLKGRQHLKWFSE